MTPFRYVVVAGTLTFLVAATPRAAGAQSTVILTSVRDTTGAPVRPSRIDVKGTNLFAFGDTLGRVLLPGVPQGRQTLIVRGIGFLERQMEVEARGDTVRLAAVVLRHNPILDSLKVVAP